MMDNKHKHKHKDDLRNNDNPTNVVKFARKHSVPLGQVARCVSHYFDESDHENDNENDNNDNKADNNNQPDSNPDETSVPLVLHWDVNETILVGDEAGGDTVEDCLHKCLAKTAFCQKPNDHIMDDTDTDSDDECKNTMDWEPTHWWNGQAIGNSKDLFTSYRVVPPLYTGFVWPPNTVPYDRTKLRQLRPVSQFAQNDGTIYQATYQALQHALPTTTTTTLLSHDNDNNNSTQSTPPLPKLLPFLLPAFWEALQFLSTSSGAWTVVFRTFGTDLPDVAAAVTAFARGQHPDHPHFRDPRLEMDPAHQILYGKWILQDNDSDNDNSDNNDNDNNYQYQLSNAQHTVVAAGDAAVLEFFQTNRQRCCIWGIVDDYPFWEQHGKAPWAGKPVWKVPHQHHLLMDDNLFPLANYSIASVRRPVTTKNHSNQHSQQQFESLPHDELLAEHGTHLLRVPTVDVILDPTWFVRHITTARQRFAAAQQQREQS